MTCLSRNQEKSANRTLRFAKVYRLQKFGRK